MPGLKGYIRHSRIDPNATVNFNQLWKDWNPAIIESCQDWLIERYNPSKSDVVRCTDFLIGSIRFGVQEPTLSFLMADGSKPSRGVHFPLTGGRADMGNERSVMYRVLAQCDCALIRMHSSNTLVIRNRPYLHTATEYSKSPGSK